MDDDRRQQLLDWEDEHPTELRQFLDWVDEQIHQEWPTFPEEVFIDGE